MASGVYLRQGEKLIAMVEQPYATEDILQNQLEDYPELLVDDREGGEPRRWLLIAREVALASDDSGGGRWSVDHLFVDQDGCADAGRGQAQLGHANPPQGRGAGSSSALTESGRSPTSA